VSKYQDSAWGRLDSVPRDVKEVKKALEGQGFNVETILNPTKQDMNDRIEQFISDYGWEKNNRLLFYYSGHGYTQERDGRQFGYLVPSDAPNPLTDEKGFFRKSLKMTRILSWAKEIESKHALFVFDSCFSGSVLRSRALPVPEDISYSTSKPVRQFISAGRADQPVPSESVFRPLFIRGINGKADLDGDGYVTGVELGMYLQKKVPTYESEQTPQYGKIRDPYLDEGNFVFIVPQGKAVIGSSKQTFVEENEIGSSDNKRKKIKRVLFSRMINGKWFWFVKKDKKDYSKWFGEIENGLPNGEGTETLKDGSVYVGEFYKGERSGEGKVTYSDGTIYEGQWNKFEFNGTGKYIIPNGEKYVGEFKDGKKHGQGTYTFPNGDKYVGRYKDGKRNGAGTITQADGTRHAGEYKNGKANGQGIYIFGKGKSKGQKYIGEFQNGLMHGKGTSTALDGTKYTGIYKNGRLWNGTVFQQNGEEIYERINGELNIIISN
jgi:hypothetical protein